MSHARSTRLPSRLAAAVALVVAALAVASGLAAPAHAQGAAYWVDPAGSDTNAGTSAAPFKTLQKALDVAQAGATINLKPGTYREAVITKRPGTAAAPITIKGTTANRTDAVLYGLGGRVFSIDHSYYTLDGFTIDGQQNIARSEYQNKTLSQVRAFKDSVQSRAVNSKLVYVGASNTSADIVGTTISNMFLTGSGGECVRFRNRAANSLVVNSLIQWCGMLGQGVEPEQYKYHNAEGVYIGTSPKSTTQPMYQNDASNNIVVRDSTINTFGSECFEVKENAHHNRMENSDCGYNDEPLAQQGSNVELRGDHNTVLRSRLYESRSWNMKLASDSATYDRGGNTAQITDFKRAAAPAIVNRQTGSGPFCSDTFDGTVSEGNSIGNPTVACAGVDTTAPTVTARTPAVNATAVAVTTDVTATFSEAVDGVAPATFALKNTATGAAVAAAVTYDAASRTATLNPTADLAASTGYTATLTGGASAIRDVPGNPLATVSWTFTTAAGTTPPPGDTTAPTVTARTPATATGVAVGNDITATFSEAVQGVSGTTFTLKPGTSSTATSVTAVVSYNAATRTATLNPSANLAANAQYTARLTGGTSAIRDMANNPLANVSWTFTTAAPADTRAPTVTSRNPSSGGTGVSRTANITATFSEAVTNVVATSGSTPGTFTLKTSSGSEVTATVRRNGTTNQWILDPGPTLASRTTYTVSLVGGASGIKDAAGNPLATNVTWSFRTSG
jgi:hypothetical protein